MNKKKSINKLILLSTLIISITICGCDITNNNSTITRINQSNETIKELKIASLFALSGPAANMGEESLKGFESAIEYFKEQNPNIIITYYNSDSKADPKTATNEVYKLYDINKIPVIYSGLSTITSNIAPIADEKDKLIITDAGLETITNHKSVYRNFKTTISNLPDLLDNKNYSKIALVYIQDEFGEKIKSDIQNNFKGDVIYESFTKDTTDFKTQSLKIKTFNPQLIVIIGYAYNQIIYDIQKYTHIENNQILTYLSCTLPNVLIDEQLNLENISTLEYPTPWETNNNNLTKAYLAKIDKPNTFNAISFENTYIVLQAMILAENPNNITQIRNNLDTLNIEGIFGNIKFEKQDILRYLVLKQIHNGQCVS